VTRYSLETNKGESDLWLVSTEESGNGGDSREPRRLTWNKGRDSAPVWSPDGRHIAFLSKRDEEGPAQIYLLSLSSDGPAGEARPLTELPIAAGALRWFPDGKRIGFLAATWPDLNDDFEAVKKRLDERKEDKVQAKITESRLVRFWDHYLTDGRYPHLFTVEVESGAVKDHTPGWARHMGLMGLGDSWDLSPDGREAVFAANATEPPHQDINYDLFTLSLVPPTEGEGEPEPGDLIKNLTAGNPADDGSPRYTPDGRFILYSRSDRPHIHPDFQHLARYDRRTGEVEELAVEWTEANASPSLAAVTEDGSTVLFHGQSRGRVHLYAISIEGGEPRKLAEGGRIGGAAVAAGTVVFQRQSIQSPADLFALDLIDLEAGGERRLTAFNRERLAEVDLGTVEEHTFAGAGGEEVHLWLVYPPDFDAGKKWPLLHAVHGGPHGAFLDAFHYRWNLALFAASGRVVAAVNFHGSTGYGQAFAESLLGNHAEKPFEDIQKATDFLLAKGFVDPDRMAAAGGSYGGYMVSWILGHTDRFQALINHAGVYDLMGQFASDYTWGRDHNYGAAPWNDPDRVDLYSPSRYAPNFKTPTLVIHGELDYRVPYTQGINQYQVLKAMGVPARLVIFPDENHWILKPQNAVVWWREVYDWLERYTGSGATGADSEKGSEKDAGDDGGENAEED
jgi:dipeptidyl aminopeptidase/acylaminoacyl peptidase